MKYARKRDANERVIIDALRAAGASVQQLDVAGVPDLLVGYQGRNVLLEVKQSHGVPKAGGRRSDDGLLASQRSWWAHWMGAPPVVVTTAVEALAAIGWPEELRPAPTCDDDIPF